MARKGRRPTYGSATRIAQLLLELRERRLGWRFEAICHRFDISERTLARYIEALKSGFLKRYGQPVIEVVSRGNGRMLRFIDPHETPGSNAFEAASLFFTLTILRFLSGTVLEQGVEDLWDRVYEAMPPSQRMRLEDLQRKFYTVAYVPKDYRKFDEYLDVILRALLNQHRLRIEYRAIGGGGRSHQFDPYTLLAYRGGLYLLGKSDHGDTIIYLAVERMHDVEFAHDDQGHPIRFALPRAYDPAKYTEGVFGLVSGEETDVELLVLSEDTETYLRSRTIHPSQKFQPGPGGKTVLTMRMRGTVELRNWILSFGPWIEVLKPEVLRNEVAGMLSAAAARYGPPRPAHRRALAPRAST
ncbi:MAG: helix-turn-helix transcriptional regulator [Candidatus Binataceae bacterium]